MRTCNADVNVFYSAADPEVAVRFLKKLQAKGIERHSLAVDPGFVDPAKGDFRLKPDSPALKLGFQPIDTRGIGLLPDIPKQCVSENQQAAERRAQRDLLLWRNEPRSGFARRLVREPPGR